MKKLLIATAALAMVAGTAQAQSSVTVYGLLDMGYNATDYKNNANAAGANGKTTTMGALSALSSSRLGFRGTEDLGGGTSAIFQLELGFQSQDINTGTVASNTAFTNSTSSAAAVVGAEDSSTNLNTAIDAARIFTVGLSDKALGTLRIGRDKAPAQLAVEKYTAGGANNSVGEFFLYDNAANFGGGANVADYDATKETFGERVSGGFFYTSPTFNGFTVNALYANDKSTDNDGTVTTVNRKATNTGISVAYEGIQNLSLTYAMHDQAVREVGATADLKNKLQTIGASYRLGAAQLFGQWIDTEKKSIAGAQTVALNGYQFGVGYTMGKTYLHAQMGDAEQEAAAGVKSYDRKGYQIGARYDMSKRTSVYALYGEQEAKSVTAGSATNEVSAINIGVRHSF
jgi:predicted porin